MGMTERTEEEQKKYTDGLKKTLTPGVFGIIGGIVTFFATQGSTDQIGFTILALMIGIQYPIYGQIGIDVREFKPKDWIYISAMTFLFWFATWTMVINV
ncbi:MAG: hypothetical protein SVM80_08920 [Halobacteriota archaeon]|nr:hypothetical protein [Halobacteriota archaeon]